MRPHDSGYALGRDPAETDRLKQQAVELRPHALALLDHVGLAPGATAIDLGCGPVGILDLLAERVGPVGRVVGLDSDPAHVALARQLADEQGNVEIIEGDARRTGLPSAAFDLVHARTLLVTVQDPESVVAEMTRLARPGGYVALHEPDVSVAVQHPSHPALERLYDLFMAAFQEQGADLRIGRRLTAFLRGAGLVDVGVEARADVYPLGHTRRTVVPDLVRSLRPKIVERGFASQCELERLDREARQHLADTDVLVLPNLFFVAWGRTPA
jgi:SAM-dependent methyltransferase